MLGKNYFDLAQAIYRASSFDELADLLVAKVPALIGAKETVVYGISAQRGVTSVFGTGNIARYVAGRMDTMNRMAGKHLIYERAEITDMGDLGFTMSDYMTPQEYRESEFAREVFGEHVTDDVIFGIIGGGTRYHAYLNCYFSAAGPPQESRQCFDAILLTARGVVDRLEAYNVERCVRQRVFGASATLAIFILNQQSEICPLNHAAVRYSENRWAPDEAVRPLAPAQLEMMNREMDVAWLNPVTSVWREVQLDMGGGVVTVHALPKLNGEVILMVPADGQAKVQEEPVTILTRRQREIMDWIAEGKTSAEAAIILSISPRTVEKHLEAVFQRLGVENRIAAMRRYLDLKRGE